jgi:hypothetical protein
MKTFEGENYYQILRVPGYANAIEIRGVWRDAQGVWRDAH